MAMMAGTITVNPDGTHSGSGLAKRLMDKLVAADKTGAFSSSWANLVGNFVTAIAAAVIEEVSLATVAVTTTIGTSSGFDGLQRLPASFVAGGVCVAPSSPVALSGSGSIS